MRLHVTFISPAEFVRWQAIFEGPPAKLVPFFLKGSDAVTAITRAEDGGAELNFIIPTELMRHTGLQQVLPHARYLQA